MNKLTMGSLFDGIGGFPRSGNIVGIDTIWSSEIDPCCEAVTKHHFPNIAQLGDITKINGAKVPPVDILCGGSPCQDLSVAGKRAGLAGERSGLYMEQIRIIREMRAATNNTYPRYMVWENVPGALSSNKGEDFRAVLEEAARCADPEISIPEPEIKNGKLVWKSAGCIVGDCWSIAWRILDAQFWGVPQRRRRIFLVADFGSERAGEVLFKPEGLLWNSTEGREAGKGIAADAEGSVGGSVYNESGQGYWMPDFGCLRAEGENRPTRPGHCVVQEVKCLNPSMPQSSRIYDANGIYPALSANENGGQNRQAVIVVQGDIARGAHYSQNGCGYSEDGISYTLNTIDCPAVVFTQNQRDEVRDLNGVTAALAAESGMYQTNYVCEPVHPRVCGTIAASGAGTSRPAGQCNEADMCIVQKCYRSNSFYEYEESEIGSAIRASGGNNSFGSETLVMATGQANAEFGENISTTLLAESHEQPIVTHRTTSKNRKYIIRRLTPLECDRLQGYPDNWSQVLYKSKPMSDSSRYRMDGNSVAIPCVVRVLGGIAAQTQDIVSA